MNKTFKVIWNRTLGRCVVASELAHSNAKCKSQKTGSIGHRALRGSAAFLACLAILGAGMVFPAAVNADDETGVSIRGDGVNTNITYTDPHDAGGGTINYDTVHVNSNPDQYTRSVTIGAETESQSVVNEDADTVSIDVQTNRGGVTLGTNNNGALVLSQNNDSTAGSENSRVDVTNVATADGTDIYAAANVDYVQRTYQDQHNAIMYNSSRISKLDNRMDKVGAGAAALAALHPLDFDPDSKWDFAAGYGNYRSANAVAVGAFYRPNEDTMFSVGGAFGNGENMINAGVSLKIGSGNHVSTSRVAMAKELKEVRGIVAKQDAQIAQLTSLVNALLGTNVEIDKSVMFPDVPENHWAYEAVAHMKANGLVHGYPDGEFKGDRTMTRYEFAQIIYNAAQEGAKVDPRLLNEFEPELKYIRIDTISKDKNGNPVIERVRTVK